MARSRQLRAGLIHARRIRPRMEAALCHIRDCDRAAAKADPVGCVRVSGAFAAVFLAITSISTIVTVPPAQAHTAHDVAQFIELA